MRYFILPVEVFRKIRTRYGSCQTYQDSGRVDSILHTEDWQSEPNHIRFNSKFIRPQLFRYEFESADEAKTIQNYKLIGDGDTVRLLIYEDNHLVSSIAQRTLVAAVDSCTGVSAGLVPLTAQLLMPGNHDFLYPSLLDLDSPQISEGFLESGREAIIVRGSLGLWDLLAFIDSVDHSLKRIEMTMTETENVRKERVALVKLHKEVYEPTASLLSVPEDVCISTSKTICFDAVEFDDSLTVDSIVESGL